MMVQFHCIFLFQEFVFDYLILFEITVQNFDSICGFYPQTMQFSRRRLHKDLETYYLQRHDGCFLDLKTSWGFRNSVMNLLHKCPLFVCSANIANDCLHYLSAENQGQKHIMS